MRLLFVCTGNQHRSPMAQAILSRQLAGRGLDLEVGSAGLLTGGLALPPDTREALLAVGIAPEDLASFRSTEVDPATIAEADLVLGLAREHVREVVVRVPEAWTRTFTLKELVRRGGAIGPRRAAETLEEWLDRAGEGRQRSELLGFSARDDVADPIGGPPSAFARTAQELEELCGQLATLLWP